MRFILLLIPILFLTGCWWDTPLPKIIYVDKVVFIKPPEILVRRIETPEPPPRDIFIQSSMLDRESLLTDYSIELLKHSGEINNNISTLRTWYDDQMVIYRNDNNITKGGKFWK